MGSSTVKYMKNCVQRNLFYIFINQFLSSINLFNINLTKTILKYFFSYLFGTVMNGKLEYFLDVKHYFKNKETSKSWKPGKIQILKIFFKFSMPLLCRLARFQMLLINQQMKW